MTPRLNNAYLSSHSSLEKSGVHFGNLGAFRVGSTFQNGRFSKTPNTTVYTSTILRCNFFKKFSIAVPVGAAAATWWAIDLVHSWAIEHSLSIAEAEVSSSTPRRNAPKSPA